MRQVVVTGSLAFDQVARFSGKFKEQIMPDKLHILNLSFLVDDLEVERGGTGGNIAYSLGMLGMEPYLVGALGKDGEEYLREIKKKNVDVAGVKIFGKLRTAMGFAITDKDDNQIWAFYAGAMRQSGKLKLGKGKDKFVVISPNDAKAMMAYVKECTKKGWGYMFDPAFRINDFSKEELEKGIGGAEIVIGNDYEVALMRQILNPKSEILKRKGKILVTTLGAKGALIEKGGTRWKVRAAKPKNASDPTGAGDAFRAGFVTGYLKGFGLKECGQMGAAVAVYTVEKRGAQTHKFSKRGFVKRYKENYGNTIVL